MQRILLMLAAVILTATTMSAQVVPGMKYKEIKKIYKAKDYEKSADDPYSKGLSALGSAVVPGLGQLICGETGRGIAVFAGNALFGSAAGLCASAVYNCFQKDANGNPVQDSNGDYIITDEKAAIGWSGALLGVLAGGTIYWIWNICDASKVAKIKNMYYQDLNGKTAIRFNMYPSVNLAMTSTGTKPVAGMTLSMQF